MKRLRKIAGANKRKYDVLNSESEGEKIEMEAAEWVVRLDGQVSSSDQHAFRLWLSKSENHERAFSIASAVWAEAAALQKSARPAYYQDTSFTAPVVQGYFRPKSRRIFGPVAALAACLTAIIGGTTYWVGDPIIALTADYHTEPGEQRLIKLVDGSTIELGPNSAIDIRFSSEERRVELLSGVAYFIAAPRAGSEKRSFIVESAGGQVTAVGTQFSVDRLEDGADVIVAEHQVDVALMTRDENQLPIRLPEGSRVHYSEAAGVGSVEKVDIEQATGWRRGRLVFDDVPLSRVITELNRYRRGRIVIANKDIALRRVSGVFDTRDLGTALGRIATELNLRTASVPPVVTVLY
ncbi:FecR family protein [Rhizobium sp. SYY.PMSO]|uniref:FecR family protein n=1 Tax=Rhizobium sp. SYY.PMSO TaxID=3382192 RepID=UPI00399025EF